MYKVSISRGPNCHLALVLISVSRLQGYPWVTPGAFSDSTGAGGDGEGDFAQSNRTNNKSKNEATAGIDE